MVVVPSRCCSWRISARVATRSAASRFESGSSIRNAAGSRTIARPSATRWRWPPETALGLRSSSLSRSSTFAASLTRRLISSFGVFSSFKPNARLSNTVMCGYSAYDWKTIAMFRSFDGTRFTTRSPIRSNPVVMSSRPATQRTAVVLPQPEGPTRTRNSPSSISRSRSSTAVTSGEYFFVTWSKGTVALRSRMLLRHRLGSKVLELSDELLALVHQPSVLEHPARHASLDGFHERDVLAADLVVEGDELVDPLLVDVRCEEVVEPALRPLGAGRNERAARQVRVPREDVDAEVRPQEVELAVRDLAAGEERAHAVAQLAELRRRQAIGFEAVAVRRDVDGGAEPGMRDGAVVALEEVLARDLPVRLHRELAAETEPKGVEVDDSCHEIRQRPERVAQRRRIGIRVDEDERPPRIDGKRQQPQLVPVEALLTVGARRRAPPSVELESPRVIPALQRFAASVTVGDGEAAMPADVEQRAQLAVARARHDHGNLSDGRREERAGLRDLTCMPHVLPRAGEDPLLLASQHGLVRVPRPWKRRLHVEKRLVCGRWPSRRRASLRRSSSSWPTGASRPASRSRPTPNPSTSSATCRVSSTCGASASRVAGPIS